MATKFQNFQEKPLLCLYRQIRELGDQNSQFKNTFDYTLISRNDALIKRLESNAVQNEEMCRKIAQNTANSANRQLKINLNRQIKQLASTFKNKFKEQNSMMQNLLANNETGVMQPKVSLNLEQSLSKIVEDLATNKGLITKTIDKDSF